MIAARTLLLLLCVLFTTFPSAAFALDELEPNNTPAQAIPLDLSQAVKVRASIENGSDVDVYSFAANGGDRLFAATMTGFSPSMSLNTIIQVRDWNGTVIEEDDDDGAFDSQSSSIAGRSFPAAGTYYLYVIGSTGAASHASYFLYAAILPVGAAVTDESEPNNTAAAANALPASLAVRGTLPPGTSDYFSIDLIAGDNLFLSLDMDPDRLGHNFNARIDLYTAPPSEALILSADSSDDPIAAGHYRSEALQVSIKLSGRYYIRVNRAGGGIGSYNYLLKAAVLSNLFNLTGCLPFSSTHTPLAIDEGIALSTRSSIEVSESMLIDKMRVVIVLDHPRMSDLRVILNGPDRSRVVMLKEIPAPPIGTAQAFTLDDDAAVPAKYVKFAGAVIAQPEPEVRLNWLSGSNAAGTWSLDVLDIVAGMTGSLVGWGLVLCPEPEELMPCAAGNVPITLLNAEFEGGADGFTHNGTHDEWEQGYALVPLYAGCYQGSKCWKTDLDDKYEPSSNNSLYSPLVDLAGIVPPIQLVWHQTYQFDWYPYLRASVIASGPGGSMQRVLWRWLDSRMVVNLDGIGAYERSGMNRVVADISDYAGGMFQVGFNLYTEAAVYEMAGWAIDKISIRGCAPDLDGDGVRDSADGCPNDSAKTAPGICGCGFAEAASVEACPPDSDGDGRGDAYDGCPIDAHKTAPGICGCGFTEAASVEACPPDSDGDGRGDAYDGCPIDAHKTAPSICGCGITEAASVEACPPDSDGDGRGDAYDACPLNPSKVTAGICGCGAAETDTNGDSVTDCGTLVNLTSTSLPQIVRIVVKRRKATVYLQKFSGPNLTYELKLIRPGARVKSYNAKKNVYSFKNLKPGNYRPSFRVRQQLKRGRIYSLSSTEKGFAIQ